MAVAQLYTVWVQPLVRNGSTVLVASIICMLLLVAYWHANNERPYPGFKLIGKEPEEWLHIRAKARFTNNAHSIMKRGYQEVIGNAGPLLILPVSFLDDVRNDDWLTLTGFVENHFLPAYPGLEAFASSTEVMLEVIRKNVTQSLGLMTDSLAEEAKVVLTRYIQTGTKQWQEVEFVHLALKMAACLSAKVFLGETICRNENWIDISIRFAVDANKASMALRKWPPFLRPFVHRFLPDMKIARKHRQAARDVIVPEVALRRKKREEAMMDGKLPKSNDVISWMDDARKDRPFDVVNGQLFLSIVAIHSTAMTLIAVMSDLIAHPEYIEPLREEISTVLKEDGGWKKTSLHKMKLLDSCMKESQMLHVLTAAVFNRRVEKPVDLRDGTQLPAGAILSAPTYHMTDPDLWGPDATSFDGYRFLRKRAEPGQNNSWQFATVSLDHLGFGYGKHACPGRFLAGTEIKIALAHLLLNYNWKFKGEEPKSLMESDLMYDSNIKFQCAIREPEVEV